MIIAHIEGATRICGKAQGYLGLPLRDELIRDTVNGEGTPAMVTAWTPTPDELAALNAGASVPCAHSRQHAAAYDGFGRTSAAERRMTHGQR